MIDNNDMDFSNSGDVTKPIRTHHTYHLARVGHRILAMLIDLIICIPFSLVVTWMTLRFSGIYSTMNDETIRFPWQTLLSDQTPSDAFWGLFGIFALFYFFFFQSLGGRTLGMRLFHLYVIDEYGASPSLIRILILTLTFLLTIATATFGFWILILNNERQSLHDRLSKTYVIIMS